eukprot:IDg20618t1
MQSQFPPTASSAATLGARLGVLSQRSTSREGGNGDSAPMKLVLQLSANALEGLESRRNHRQDFFATAEVRDPDGGAGWVDLGKTEVVYNSSSPSWATTFNLDYSFYATKLLRFRVLRVEPPGPGGQRKFKPLGEVQCTIAIIVLADGKVAVERLRP